MKVYGQIIHALTEMRRSDVDRLQLRQKWIQIMPDIKYSKLMSEVFDLPEKIEDLKCGMENLELSKCATENCS